MEKKTKPLAKVAKTERGFQTVTFEDDYGVPCSIQQSSVIGKYEDSFKRPGTSALWVGCDEADPRVLASKAASLGVKTEETTGWVPFPLSKEVLLNTHMHLNREQVAGLIVHLQAWLDTGSLKTPPKRTEKGRPK